MEVSRPFVVIVHSEPDETYDKLLDDRQIRRVGVTGESYTVTPDFLEETRHKLGKRYLYLSVYDLTPEQVQRFLSSLVFSVRSSCDLCLLVDEAHSFCRRPFVAPAFLAFSRGARRYGVDLIYCTHRVRDLDIAIRANVSHLVLFRTMEGRDVKILRDELNLGRYADALRTLPDWYHFYVVRSSSRIHGPMRL